MENADILTLAVTGVTFLGLVFNLIKEWKNDDKLSKEHSDLTDKLSKEHSELSKEHDNLSISIQNRINDKSDILKEQQSRIENSVSYIEKQVYAKERSRVELSNKELDIAKTAEHINSLVSMIADMKSENEALKRENAELRDRIYSLERDEEMEL